MFFTTRHLSANIPRALQVSTCNTNMAAPYDRMIVIWKAVLKQFSTTQF